DVLIARYPTAKRTTLRRMLQAGRVAVNGQRPRSLSIPVHPHDRVHVSDPPAQRPSAPPFQIIHEDDDLLVVNKSHGVLTSTTPREKRPTLLAQVKAYLAETSPRARPGLIHRLDKDAAGLLIFSKTDLAYRSLKTQFFFHN